MILVLFSWVWWWLYGCYDFSIAYRNICDSASWFLMHGLFYCENTNTRIMTTKQMGLKSTDISAIPALFTQIFSMLISSWVHPVWTNLMRSIVAYFQNFIAWTQPLWIYNYIGIIEWMPLEYAIHWWIYSMLLCDRYQVEPKFTISYTISIQQ